MKPEILAPAGSNESFEAALAAGCDAVYFGLPQFGARAFANNFTLEEAKERIERCHLLGVKAYVTMNIVLYEGEMEEAYQQALELHKMGVDALIVQDLGFMHLLHRRLPNLVLHASTQLSTSQPEMIEKLKELGVKRVVLARECTKEEIVACQKAGLEIEVFVHGALCICYSGQCTFSSFRYDRSGNRGKCAQPCRMPYMLYEDGKKLDTKGDFLLSPKDLSLQDHLEDLIDMGVTSLKIEGRMKSAEYVYESVRAISKGLEGKRLSAKDKENLQVTFYRGFTEGHMYQAIGNALMNTNSSNHQGLIIGKVISSKGKRVKIQLTNDLYQHDGIRFETSKEGIGCYVNYLYDKQGKLTNYVEKGAICEVEAPTAIPSNTVIRKTIDSNLKKEIHTNLQHMHRQIVVNVHCECKNISEPLKMYLSDGVHNVVVVSSFVASQAMNCPTTEEVLFKQMNKTKDTFMRIGTFTCDLASSIYFSISQLNELRREGIEALRQARIHVDEVVEQAYSYTFEPVSLSHDMIETQTTYPHIMDAYWVQEGKNKCNLAHAKGEVLSLLGEGQFVDSSMNVTNSYAVAALLEMGYRGVVLSEECNLEQCIELSQAFIRRYGFKPPVFKTVYQKRRMMVMKHCPINTLLKDGKRENCSLCHTHTYTLVSKDKSSLFCLGDTECHMRLYDEKATNQMDWIQSLKNAGIDHFKLTFVNETQTEMEAVLKKFDHLKHSLYIETNAF